MAEGREIRLGVRVRARRSRNNRKVERAPQAQWAFYGREPRLRDEDEIDLMVQSLAKDAHLVQRFTGFRGIDGKKQRKRVRCVQL